MRSCLIIGAGIAGLTAADVLQTNGWAVKVLDKGRSPGGRMATRRLGESRLDHGAQFFTARDPRFLAAAQRWEAAGWIAPWYGDAGHPRYKSPGGMNMLARRLAEGLPVRTEAKVDRLSPVNTGWQAVTDAGARFQADALLLTAPAPQSLALLDGVAEPAVIAALRAVEYDPCFALLLVLGGPSLVPPPGHVTVDQGPIEWIADNTQKGLNTGAAALTIHARADFSRRHMEASAEEVEVLLLDAARPWLGANVQLSQLHRWRYARPVTTSGRAFLHAAKPAPLAIAGDAFGGPRVEGAFLSGLAAAECLIAG